MNMTTREKIKDYYFKFKNIYIEKNYPEWFRFKNLHNQKFGEKGFNSNEHELGHWAILQTELPEIVKVVMVGKNNSWFVRGNMEKSLKVVKKLENGIPKEDYLSSNGSNFSNRLNSQINKIGKINKSYEEALTYYRVGINKMWLQTGADYPHKELKKEMNQNEKLKNEWEEIEEKCHIWTEDIIRLIAPKLVILFGNDSDKKCAWNLFNKNLDGESFLIEHCPHPVGNKIGQFSKKIKHAMEIYERKNGKI